MTWLAEPKLAKARSTEEVRPSPFGPPAQQPSLADFLGLPSRSSPIMEVDAAAMSNRRAKAGGPGET
ncbi:MAG: hypothetical protein ACRD2U_16650 [Terriglobales bacterium]